MEAIVRTFLSSNNQNHKLLLYNEAVNWGLEDGNICMYVRKYKMNYCFVGCFGRDEIKIYYVIQFSVTLQSGLFGYQ